MTGIDSWIRRHRHKVLLVALLVMSLAQPMARGFVGGLILYDLLLTAILMGIFAVVFAGSRERPLAIGLALSAIAARWAEYGLVGAMHRAAAALHHGIVIVYLAFAVGVILRGVYRERLITFDQVLGTVCGYLLTAVAWGSALYLVDLLVPDSFAIAPDIAWELDDQHSRAALFQYVSLSTLTGLGYNDVTPTAPIANFLTWTEAVFGQFYIAVVVAELIGLKLAQPPAAPVG